TFWLTYDKQLDEWTQKYLGQNPSEASKYMGQTSYSKYGINFTFASEAPKKLISDFEVILEQDSISENQRNVEFIIVPTRKVNRIDLYSEEENAITKLEFNGKMMPITNDPKLYRGTKNAALVSYFVSNGDS